MPAKPAKSTKSTKSAKPAKSAKKPRPKLKSRPKLKPGPDGVVRLSGGNPQIPKGFGDAPVQAFIKAMLGWQSYVGRRIDDIVTAEVPGVRKAVKWNSPFYGVDEDHYFLSFHCFTKYVKVTFLNGAQLDPPPPGPSKHPGVRYLDIYEAPPLDDARFADWVRQASALPGEKM